MHLIFLAARILPYWAIPIALVCGQLAIHFTRRQSKVAYLWWGTVAGLFLTSGFWIFFRGDLHSDDWLRWLF